MNAATDRGDARPLPGYGWVMQYLGGWWVVWEHGWLRVTDEQAVQELDAITERLAEAGEIAAREAAERRDGLAREAAQDPGGSRASGGGSHPPLDAGGGQ